MAIFRRERKNKDISEEMIGNNRESNERAAVDEERIRKWNNELRKYKNGKRAAEQRIRSNEEFWRVRPWKALSDSADTPSTAWLFTCIQSKLADAMDSYPTANFRARQQDDKSEAEKLSSIVPVIMEQNNFEKTYHDVAKYTIENGIGIYGIFWDGSKHNGIGDISIEKVDVFNIFWEPGVTDIQKSNLIFNIRLEDNDTINQMYPQTVGNLKKNVELTEYIYKDGHIDTAEKTPIIDVYYHVHSEGRNILHFAKYVGDTILVSTENEPEKYPNGWYAHGMYPFEVQPLFMTEGTLFGLGLVDIGKSTQLSIDLLNEAMLKNSLMGSSPRYLVSKSAGINKEQFADWTEPFVEVPSLSEQYIREVNVTGLSGNYMSFLNNKIEELKYITSNQDVNNGATPSGITAASAVAALQETAGKHSRSMNRTFYQTYRRVVNQVIELIREFYDIPRQFRIIPDEMGGGEQFTQYSNAGLKLQPNGSIMGDDMGFRKPEFDIEVTAEKANPYRKMEVNELAINFYKLGFFNPQMCDQALATLEMMDFEHKSDIVNRVQMNGTLLQKLTQLGQMAIALAQKYGDAEALMMIQGSLGGGGQAVASPSSVDAEKMTDGGETGEPSHIRRARKQARESTEAE